MPPPYTALRSDNVLGAIIGDIVGSIYEPKDRRKLCQISTFDAKVASVSATIDK